MDNVAGTLHANVCVCVCVFFVVLSTSLCLRIWFWLVGSSKKQVQNYGQYRVNAVHACAILSWSCQKIKNLVLVVWCGSLV